LILELIHLGGVLRVIEVYGGLKFLNLWLHLVKQFMERFGGSCELIDNLLHFGAEFVLEVAWDLASHLDDSLSDFFVITLSLDLVLDKEDIVQNLFHTGLGSSLFLCVNSDIAVLQEVSKLFVE
jgi:hypothetical protein